MQPSFISIIDYDLTCGAGIGLRAVRDALTNQTTGLKPNDLPHSGLPTWIGKVAGLDDITWTEAEQQWQSRNNALIRLALGQGSIKQTIKRIQQQVESHRIGVIIGSSTSSIDRSEAAYREEQQQGELPSEFKQQQLVLNPHAPSLYVAHLLDLHGPTLTINTACSSSAKVFASAERWLRCGLVDAVLVGGADTLALSVLHGFHSLQLVSANPCKPFDKKRDGINLGEAAGFAVLVRDNEFDSASNIILSGCGESSDAHHMSHPHPNGEGARLAIEQSLRHAGLSVGDIGYINLHGTASRVNDEIEGCLVASMFPANTLKSSTKGWTGHTLGAAGIAEAVIAMDALTTELIPGTLNLNEVDPGMELNLSAQNCTRSIQHAMTNSFGFGGNNATLIFSKK